MFDLQRRAATPELRPPSSRSSHTLSGVRLILNFASVLVDKPIVEASISPSKPSPAATQAPTGYRTARNNFSISPAGTGLLK
jgi:hypothetical protein